MSDPIRDALEAATCALCREAKSCRDDCGGKCAWREADVNMPACAAAAEPMPRRIQRSRAKGWRMPENTVYIGRPSMDANRHLVVRDGRLWGVWIGGTMDTVTCGNRAEAHALAVTLFRQDMEAARTHDPEAFGLTMKRLRGRSLCCWCPPDLACHADVLIEIANTPLRCEAADE